MTEWLNKGKLPESPGKHLSPVAVSRFGKEETFAEFWEKIIQPIEREAKIESKHLYPSRMIL